MSGDYSRYRYAPADDHAGVLLQQGRPLTDWDWNTQQAIAARRAQATAYDTFGAQAVVPTSTPDAFALTLDAQQQLQIGPGRLYVDGILVENHGLAPLAWDPALAETRGTLPVPFTKQPYLPAAKLPKDGGPYLVYLDVWQRELTHIEAPELVDVALGIDTTTRLQTVWQVRCIAASTASPYSCSTPAAQIPQWAPSAARLTTDTASFGAPSPCLIPPAGGYTGRENQLYRVEIHQGGAAGKATFKWSRDNASIVSRVSRFIDASHLVVESIGKDDVLRFRDGDWVEVTDDVLELNGKPGELRRIVIGGGVDDGSRTLTLEQPLTTTLFPVNAQGQPDPKRHTRVRKWDQHGIVLRTDGAQPLTYVDVDAAGSSGAIPVPASGSITLTLEAGIVLRFDLAQAGAEFRSGDWWVFAARSADASIEKLVQAPPRGIHHHYAKLGIWTPGQIPSDCRVFWPPKQAEGENCACTVCVSPEEQRENPAALQKAVDRLAANGGGSLCLLPGTYELKETLRIATPSSITLRGHGAATRLRAPGTAIELIGPGPVQLVDFVALTAPGEEDKQPAVVLLHQTGRDDKTVEKPADKAVISEFRLRGLGLNNKSKLSTASAIRIEGEQTVPATLYVEDCMLQASLGIFGGDVLAGGLIIDRCRIAARIVGIRLELAPTGAAPLRITRNQIEGCTTAGIVFVRATRNAIADSTSTVARERDIHDNTLRVAGTGLSSAVSGLSICGNALSWSGKKLVRDEAKNNASPLFIGIELLGNAEIPADGDIDLHDNRIDGFPQAAVVCVLPVQAFRASRNRLLNGGAGLCVFGSILVDLNHNHVGPFDGTDLNPDAGFLFGSYGLFAAWCLEARINHNIIGALVLTESTEVLSLSGISAMMCLNLSIGGNQIHSIGPAVRFQGEAYGIFANSIGGRISITDNQIQRDLIETAQQLDKADDSLWSAVRVDDLVINTDNNAAPTATHVSTAGSAAGSAAVSTQLNILPSASLRKSAQSFARAQQQQPQLPPPLMLSVRGNQLSSRGAARLAWLRAFGTLDFSHNQCLRVAPQDDRLRLPDTELASMTITAQSNRIHGSATALLLRVGIIKERPLATVLGNLCHGQIELPQLGNTLPAPWDALNLVGV